MIRRLATMAAAVVLAVALAAPPASADDIDIEASINGVDLADASSSDPAELRPGPDNEIVLSATNTTDDEVTVGWLRVTGSVIGVNFLTYETTVGVPVAAGDSTSVQLPLEFFDLESQATGLVRAELTLYDLDREVVGSTKFIADVRGNATSALGWFALAILLFTLLTIASLAAAVYGRRLRSNRFTRGAQFAALGLGVGLLVTVGLSVVRIAAVPASAWVPLVLLPTIGTFILGYFAPGSLSEAVRDPDPDDEVDTGTGRDDRGYDEFATTIS